MHGEIVLIGQSFMGVGQGASHWGVIRATLGDNRGDGWCVWRRARRRRKRGLCAQQACFGSSRVKRRQANADAWPGSITLVWWWRCGGCAVVVMVVVVKGGVPSDRVWGVRGKGVRCVCGSNLPCLLGVQDVDLSNPNLSVTSPKK
jgi:hypothetical protein